MDIGEILARAPVIPVLVIDDVANARPIAEALIAGGVQSLSMTPLMNWRIPGPELKFEERWMPPTHPETPDAPCKDMSITVGWNTAQAVGITREEMDAWAARSHQRAIAAIDAGKFVDDLKPAACLSVALVRSPHGVESMRIRQSHVQQDYVHAAFRKMNHGFTHAQQVRQFETARSLRTEHLAEQAGISRVILNQ